MDKLKGNFMQVSENVSGLVGRVCCVSLGAPLLMAANNDLTSSAGWLLASLLALGAIAGLLASSDKRGFVLTGATLLVVGGGGSLIFMSWVYVGISHAASDPRLRQAMLAQGDQDPQQMLAGALPVFYIALALAAALLALGIYVFAARRGAR